MGRMERSSPLDQFDEGDLLMKHCTPYGAGGGPLLNSVVRLEKKISLSDGRMVGAIVTIVSDAQKQLYEIDGSFFSGWTCPAKDRVRMQAEREALTSLEVHWPAAKRESTSLYTYSNGCVF